MEENKKDILSVAEFAVEIGAHRNTVLKMINQHRIIAFRLTGEPKSRYRISRTEIQRIAVVGLEEMIEKEVEKKINEKRK